jgi:TusA-related sulfurtransferase
VRRRRGGALTAQETRMVLKKLDVRGTKCPIPIVKAKKEIDALAPGDQIEVIATDPGSMPDFVGWAKTSKNALLKSQRTEKDETGKDVYIHVLERK